ncbi:SERTA domain-containing protein 3 [Paramarasmius palmivorus]|uniref:SERTA domain-containing protein 3 n=1 Tax=Paramarasmius palmivorus TaxID=297713 RepID=A0AAW0BT27_9AGAR
MGNSRRKSDKSQKKPEKRGNPGLFQGEPLGDLEGWVGEYISSRGNRAPFWARFYGAWRTKYPSLNASEKEELRLLKLRLGIKDALVDREVLPSDGEEDTTSAANNAGPSTEDVPNGPVAEPETSAAAAIGTPNTHEDLPSDPNATTNDHSSSEPSVAGALDASSEAPGGPNIPLESDKAPCESSITQSEGSHKSTLDLVEAPSDASPVPANPVENSEASSETVINNSTSVKDTDVVPGASGIQTTQPLAIDSDSDSDTDTSNNKSKKNKNKKNKNRKKKKRTEAENILIARGATDERLKTWFSTRAVKEGRNKEDWDGFMSHFNKDHGSVPRHVPDYKIYEGQEQFKEKIDRKVSEKYGENLGEREWLSAHVAAAKELFEMEDDETKAEMRQKGKEVYQSRRAAYDKLVNGEGLTDPSQVDALRDQMSAKLESLINGIAKSTNCYISFLAIGYNGEGASEDDAFFCNILAGATPEPEPRKFDQWDPVGYKMHHVRSFAEFVKSCSRLQKGYPASPPQHTPDIVERSKADDIIAPTVDIRPTDSSTLAAHSSCATAMAVSSTSSTQAVAASSSLPRKRSRRNSNSSDDTTHSPTPELSDGDDNDQIRDVDAVDYGECGIKLTKGRRMGKNLALELKTMSRKDRTRHMLVYSKYNQRELDREDKKAKIRLESMLQQDSEEEDDGKVERDEELAASEPVKGKGKSKEYTRPKTKRLRTEKDTQTPLQSTLPLPTATNIDHSSTSIPDTEVGARVTATGTGNAQASASALITIDGDADVYATARSSGGATSSARATARGSGQRSDSVTSSAINVDTKSAPPSPVKVSDGPLASNNSLLSPSPAGPSPSHTPSLPPTSNDSGSANEKARKSPSSSQLSSSRPPSSSSSSSLQKIPSWFPPLKKFLLSNISGSDWVQAIDCWEDLERGFGFVNQRQTLPTEKRPDAVTFWAKRARKSGTPPDAQDAKSFGPAVLAWWSSMMPDWRTKDAEGQWLRAGEGSWGSLRCPGANGLLSILACLKWWLLAEGDGSEASTGNASASWHSLLEDVVWVMTELKKAEESPVRKKQRTD